MFVAHLHIYSLNPLIPLASHSAKGANVDGGAPVATVVTAPQDIQAKTRWMGPWSKDGSD